MAVKKKKKINKTAYILKHAKLTAGDLVKQAKKDGIALSDKYVYNIRSKANGSGGKARRKPGRPKGVTMEVQTPDTALADLFVSTALDLGLGKAQKLLDGIRTAAKTAASD